MRVWETGEREEVANEMVYFLPGKLSENNFYFFNSTKRKIYNLADIKTIN